MGVRDSYFGVYIGDLGALVMIPWCKVCKGGGSLGAQLVQKADATYEKANWPRSCGKDQTDVTCGEMWGGYIDGDAGWTGVSREKRAARSVVSCKSLGIPVTGRELSGILGHWSHVLQLLRPGYSVLGGAFVEAVPRPVA